MGRERDRALASIQSHPLTARDQASAHLYCGSWESGTWGRAASVPVQLSNLAAEGETLSGGDPAPPHGAGESHDPPPT